MLTAFSKYLVSAFFKPVNISLSVTLKKTYRVAWEFWNTLPIPHVVVFLDINAIYSSTDEFGLEQVELLKSVVYQCPNIYFVFTNYDPLSDRRDDLKKGFPRVVQSRIIGTTGPAYTGMAQGQIRIVRCDDSEYEKWLQAYFDEDTKANLPCPSYQPLKETGPAVGLKDEHVLIITSRYRWLMKNWV